MGDSLFFVSSAPSREIWEPTVLLEKRRRQTLNIVCNMHRLVHTGHSPGDFRQHEPNRFNAADENGSQFWVHATSYHSRDTKCRNVFDIALWEYSVPAKHSTRLSLIVSRSGLGCGFHSCFFGVEQRSSQEIRHKLKRGFC